MSLHVFYLATFDQFVKPSIKIVLLKWVFGTNCIIREGPEDNCHINFRTLCLVTAKTIAEFDNTKVRQRLIRNGECKKKL